MTNRAHFT